jgi:hypothetical protein
MNEYPDTTDISPDTTDISPDTTDISPDTTDIIPDTTDISPDTTDIIPDTTDISPDTTDISPVIVCIAKKESDYIEEFVDYHIKLGFKYIYVYDNEDEPTYEILLEKFKDYVKVIHFPKNNYHKPVQYMILDDFINNYIKNDINNHITHIIHIDIDEFIVLKKHKNISDFINEYIIGDCQGIGINWRFFGSGGLIEKISEPVTYRFITCEKDGNKHIKTLFRKDNFISYNTCHDIILSNGFIKNTKGDIIRGPFNENIDFSVIQLNHYKCKTYREYVNSRSRGRADTLSIKEDMNHINSSFFLYDLNETIDLDAKNFYKSHFDK